MVILYIMEMLLSLWSTTPWSVRSILEVWRCLHVDLPCFLQALDYWFRCIGSFFFLSIFSLLPFSPLRIRDRDPHLRLEKVTNTVNGCPCVCACVRWGWGCCLQQSSTAVTALPALPLDLLDTLQTLEVILHLTSDIIFKRAVGNPLCMQPKQ